MTRALILAALLALAACAPVQQVPFHFPAPPAGGYPHPHCSPGWITRGSVVVPTPCF